jgi:hypothetical protein
MQGTISSSILDHTPVQYGLLWVAQIEMWSFCGDTISRKKLNRPMLWALADGHTCAVFFTFAPFSTGFLNLGWDANICKDGMEVH